MKFFRPEEVNKYLKAKDGFCASLKVGRLQVACNSIEELMVEIDRKDRNILWRCSMCNKFLSDKTVAMTENFDRCPHCKERFYD